MASDEIVWQVIGQQFCSYKLKTTKNQTFCRNEFNVTGFCSRQACPLANSRYATVRSDPASGTLYLYMKTVERAHMPSKLWERIKLGQNYTQALAQIDSRLIYWPKFLIHKCKQRLTRLTQVAIRMRRLAREEERLGEKIVPKLAPKIRRREETRERKAEAAAKVERQIEIELLERLASGAYAEKGEQPLNTDANIWKKVLRGLERAGQGTRDKDLDEGIEDEEGVFEEDEEADADKSGLVEYVSDFDESEGDLDDLEDWLGSDGSESEGSGSEEEDEEGTSESEGDDSEDDKPAKKKKSAVDLKRKRSSKGPSKPKKKGPRVDIEYEIEEPILREAIAI